MSADLYRLLLQMRNRAHRVCATIHVSLVCSVRYARIQCTRERSNHIPDHISYTCSILLVLNIGISL